MFSLNEIAATAKKATRGAGYAWGVADEAGFAAKWLAARGVDGCAALAALLDMVDGLDPDLVKPNPNPDPNPDAAAASGSFLCPILTGCMMSDFGPADYHFASVASPVLLLPFVSAWGGATVTCAMGQTATDGLAVYGDCDLGALATDVRVTPHVAQNVQNHETNRAAPDPAAWDILLSFAHRTYAPATEESRLKGAG